MSQKVIDELLTVLDEEHAYAVAEHRRTLRKPLSVYAARLLAKQFGKCADPNEGADEMIMRGWQGFKPEWVADRNLGKRPNYADAARNLANGQKGSFGGGNNDERVPARIGRHGGSAADDGERFEWTIQ